jgi:hypothetical protein
LFNHDGTLVLLRDGELVPGGRDILLEVLDKHVCVKRVVKNGDGRVEVAYGPVDLAEMTMRAVLLGHGDATVAVTLYCTGIFGGAGELINNHVEHGAFLIPARYEQP